MINSPQEEESFKKMSDFVNVPEPASDRRPVKRPLSPQPSTSRAPCPPLEDLELPADVAGPPCPSLSGLERPANVAGLPCPPQSDLQVPGTSAGFVCSERQKNSVYSHVIGDISSIGQLRGLKSGSRRGRWLRIQQAKRAERLTAKYTEKYEKVIKVLQPMLNAEVVKQQTDYVLITAALDNFANTVEGMCDKYECKEPNDYTVRLEAFKKKAAELREKRRAKNPNAAALLYGPPAPPAPQLSEEETNRRIRLEMQCAIAALEMPDKPEPTMEERFAHILEVFNKM